MTEDAARYVLDLEGRVTALSAVVGVLLWVLRQRGILDAATETLIYRSASEAIGVSRPGTEAAADRLILALQHATGLTLASPPSGCPDLPADQ